MTETKKRDITIDLLRGSAVFFMIVTHVNALFLKGSPYILERSSFIGATVCFSTFLFCSSVIYGKNLQSSEITKKSTILRVKKILIVYYLLAIFITAFSAFQTLSIKTLFEILTFQTIPLFIEFLIAFFLYDILIFVAQKPLKRLLQHPAILIGLSTFIYIVSRYLFNIETSNSALVVIKSSLVGHESLHTFGILSYFPIFAIGLVWGYWLFAKENAIKYALVIGLSSYLLLVLLKEVLGYGWERWPPSLLFHTYGISYVFIVYFLTKYIKLLKFPTRYLKYLSTYTLDFYVVHILVIFILSKFFSSVLFNGTITFFINIFVFLMSTVTIYSFHRIIQYNKE